MSPSPIGTFSSSNSQSNKNDCYSKKFSMDLVSSNSSLTSSTLGLHSSLISDAAQIKDKHFLLNNEQNINCLNDSLLFTSNLSTSPECSRSSTSSCSSLSSFTCSLVSKKNTTQLINNSNNISSICNNKQINVYNNDSIEINSPESTMLTGDAQMILHNEFLNDSNNASPICFSLDKISNHSFMEYFNLSDSISFSPPTSTSASTTTSSNIVISTTNPINANENFGLKSINLDANLKQNKTNSIVNNIVVTSTSRKKNYSFSSSSYLFPNFDDFDDNLNFYDIHDSMCDGIISENNFILNSSQDNIKKQGEILNAKIDLGELTIDDDVDDDDDDDDGDVDNQENSSSQIENSETLIAIREMAIRERRSQQRKHKNSTSSICSASMSSRIKKFAIDLQNTANNLNKDGNNSNNNQSVAIKPVPFYSNSNHINFDNHINKNSYKNDCIQINYNCNSNGNGDQVEQHNFDLEFDKISVEDGEFNDFLELEGWEQMLDEDCISRLTTDFNANISSSSKVAHTDVNVKNNNNEVTSGAKKVQQEDKNITINSLSLVVDTKTNSSENDLKNNRKTTTNTTLTTSTTNYTSNNSFLVTTTNSPNKLTCSLKFNEKKNQIVNNSQSSISSLKITTPFSCSSIKLPSTTVLSSSSIIPKLQNLSNRSTITSSINKSQPLVVVLSSTLSNASSHNPSANDLKSSTNLNQLVVSNNTTNKKLESTTLTNNHPIASSSFAQTQTNDQMIKKSTNILESKSTNVTCENSKEKNNSSIVLDGKEEKILSNSNVNSMEDLGDKEQKVKQEQNDMFNTKPNQAFVDPCVEVIDCINPEQIFPNRLVDRKKNESSFDTNSNAQTTKTKIENLEKNLRHVGQNVEEDSEEEIDVVSVNHNSISNLIGNVNCNMLENERKTNSNTKANNKSIAQNFGKNNERLNLNHHNYFHQPSSNALGNKKMSNNQTNSFQSTISQNTKQAQQLAQQQQQQQQKDNPSLLAKFLKSTNSNNLTITSSKNPTIISSSKSSDSIQDAVDSVVSKFSSTNNINNSSNLTLDGTNGKKIISNKSIEDSVLGNFAISNKISSLTNNNNNNNILLNKQKSLISNDNLIMHTQGSISKSISSPSIQKCSNTIFSTSSYQDQSKKNSFNNFLTTTSSSSNAQKLSSSIRILTTTTSNNSNSAIRQINQTTTLTSNNPNAKVTSPNSINLGTNSTQNVLQLPSNSSISKLSKSITTPHLTKNESKIITTTLIAKAHINNLNVTKTNQQQHLSNSNSLIVCSINNKKLQSKTVSSNVNDQEIDSLNDFKQRLLFSKTNGNSKEKVNELKQQVKKISKGFKSNANKFCLNTKSSVDEEYEFDDTNGFYYDDFEDEIEEDVDDDNDNDVDDDDDDDNVDDDDDEANEVSDQSDMDEQSDDISSSLSQVNSTLSPLSLTSSGHSSVSSGCSTPTKTKFINKTNSAYNKQHFTSINNTHNNENKFDLCTLNDKIKTKNSRKNKSSMGTSGQSASSIKRNNRLNTLGYSSENPAEKRAFHILSERQRRNDLKKLFETLRTNIPNLCDKQKASKLTILKAAVDHLIEVSNKKEKLNLIFDKEKQKNAILLQNLKNLQKSFNNNNSNITSNNNSNISNISNNTNSFQNQQNSSMTTLIVH